MDIYQYLKLDHQHVDQLFKQLEKAPHTERQTEIFKFLAQELLTHAKSEEETFYKLLTQRTESQDEAFHGKEEHAEIEALVNAILSSKMNVKKVKKLKELVQHHVHEEEHEIFRQAKKVISEHEACVLKEQMHQVKQELLRRMERHA